MIDQPDWFGAVMGTGAVAAVLTMNPGALPALEPLGVALGTALYLLSAAAFVLLSIRGLFSGLFGPGLMERASSAVTGPHYATFPGAINVLAVVAVRVFPDAASTAPARWVLLVLGALGTIIGLWLTVVFFVGAFEREDFEAEEISGTWFIPETVILLGALLFGRLAETAPMEAQASLAVVALGLLGIGSILFGYTAALFINRLVLHRQVSQRGAPAMWIMLSPLSVAALAIQVVATEEDILGGTWGPAVLQTANFIAAMLWGFSLWWLAVAIVLTAHAGAAALTRTPADWGFVFPLAAFTLSTLTLADAWDSGLMHGFGGVAALFLCAVWLTVLGAAIIGLRRERHPHPARE